MDFQKKNMLFWLNMLHNGQEAIGWRSQGIVVFRDEFKSHLITHFKAKQRLIYTTSKQFVKEIFIFTKSDGLLAEGFDSNDLALDLKSHVPAHRFGIDSVLETVENCQMQINRMEKNRCFDEAYIFRIFLLENTLLLSEIDIYNIRKICINAICGTISYRKGYKIGKSLQFVSRFVSKGWLRNRTEYNFINKRINNQLKKEEIEYNIGRNHVIWDHKLRLKGYKILQIKGSVKRLKCLKKYWSKICIICYEKNDKQIIDYDDDNKHKLKICSGCKQISYCSRKHQKKHWKQIHRLCCSF